MTGADAAFACMWAFVGGLVDTGVRDACVSPGSRSTPLALALARHPAVRVRVHLDERSSAFFALGLAKASGSPVAVACTSGTAAANLFPAVVEASMSRVPLVVLTADRPPELRGVGANQTIDQVELYGRYVRAFEDAPVPGDAVSTKEWYRRGTAVVAAALSGSPGPVHVNLPFREPLVPASHEPPAEGHAASEKPPADGPAPHPVARADASASEEPPADVFRLADELFGVERGLVYAGGLRSGGRDVVATAEALGWPLVAEPHSGARRPGALAAGALLVSSQRFVAGHAPDVVLQIGAAPTSRAALGLVGVVPRLVILDPDDVVGDPLRRASHRVVATASSLRAALDRAPPASTGAWAAAWRDASGRARSRADRLLDGWDEPFEGRVARDVAAEAPGGSTLCAGSSLPIRDLDAYMRPRDGLRVVANRGASGIDGFVSTALGVAAAGAPTVALVGDLTLLHDVGALVWNARRGIDAVLVVLDNGGGAIFAGLEQRSLPELDELFVTPHGVDIASVVRAAGAGHTLVDRAGDLAGAIRAGRSAGGVHVVQVRIDPGRDRARRNEVAAAVDDAVD